MITDTKTLASAALDYVEKSAAHATRQQDELEVHHAAQAKAAAVAPNVLELLVSTGCIPAHQKQAAAAMLGSHAETLGLLSEMAQQFFKLRKSAGMPKVAADAAGGTASPAPGLPPAERTRSYNPNIIGRGSREAADQAFAASMTRHRD